jgi:hypothetical protein
MGLIAYILEGDKAKVVVKEVEDLFGEKSEDASTRVAITKND